MRPVRAPFTLLTGTIGLLLLVGCTEQGDRGGFGDAPPPTVTPSPSPTESEPEGPEQRVRVSAPGGFRYDPRALEIRAGRIIEIEFANGDGQDHTFVVSELPVAILAGAGQTVTATVEVDRANTGRFAFFCSIAGHRDAGMEGTITVG